MTAEEQDAQRAGNTESMRTRRHEARNTHLAQMEGAFGTKDIDDLQPEDLPQEFSLGPMDVVCVHCSALGFKSEKTFGREVCFGQLCCCSGKISLPHFPNPLTRLNDLIHGRNADSAFFLKNIRKFNSGMAMATLQMNEINPANGASMICIQGEVVRRVGPVNAANLESTLGIQTHWLDIEAEANTRTSLLLGQTASATKVRRTRQLFRRCHLALNNANNSHL